jgi:predicted Zn-dependent protease
MGASARAFVAVPFLVAVAWATLAASQLGASDSAVYGAGKEISTWSASGAPPGQQTVGWIRAELHEAAARDPKNASVHEMLGYLALFTPGDNSADQAITSLGEALRERPSSPYTWASLVKALYLKGETGSRFDQAIQRAAQTGPWEPMVQRTVADYGLAVWDDVSPSTRKEIERLVANGMARDAAEILQISLRRGRLGVACDHLDQSTRTDPKWTQLCQSTGGT